MTGYNFTEAVRKSLAAAREEAARLGHGFTAPDHLALGLLRTRDPVVMGVLQRLRVDADELRRAVEHSIPALKDVTVGPDLPYTARAKKVLEMAMSEARELRHSHVDSVHLLIALARDEDSAASTALRGRVTVDAIRALASQFATRTGSRSGYNFSEHVRRVLAMAREEAARFHHEYVGTEHMLLAIAREAESVAAYALGEMGVDRGKIIQLIEETVRPGETAKPTGPDLPYTSRAKKVLEESMAEARELQHSYVGVEHLLLGLMREGHGVAAQVLVQLGARLNTLRAIILRLLGSLRDDPTGMARYARLPDGDEPSSGHAAPDRATGKAAKRDARLRLARAQAEAVEESRLWSRLRNALDLCESLGTTPRLTRRPDGSVEVQVTGELSVLIPRLPGLEPRQEPPAADA